ncbi:50S ribosomal protein L25/general stress protein Ctc [Gaopeijia maritima]|uniref:Large ribosomal subunit protein bL25 n=1 Tax=Gaopeijia maritima TaxID=3119007 RepID=A0ABU9EC71_9BACT
MSMHATLKADKRDATGKGVARKLRAAGRVPAVVYGQGEEALSITLDAAETLHLFHNISVENTIVDLTVEGEGESFQTLVREIQMHPHRPDLVHVDFYRLQKGVKVDVEIPVHLVGTPEGVKSGGGVLQQVIHELPVSVIPSKIPDSFEVDVSALQVGDSLHVSELTLPDGVEEIGLEPERTICTVVLPRAAAADDAEDDDETAEPEVIGADDSSNEGGEG